MQTDYTVQLQYAEGEVAGFIDTDLFSVGSPAITIQNQGFGEMYNVSDDFTTVSSDGVLVRMQGQLCMLPAH